MRTAWEMAYARSRTLEKIYRCSGAVRVTHHLGSQAGIDSSWLGNDQSRSWPGFNAPNKRYSASPPLLSLRKRAL